MAPLRRPLRYDVDDAWEGLSGTDERAYHEWGWDVKAVDRIQGLSLPYPIPFLNVVYWEF